SITAYDALNRPVQIVAPHSNKDGTKINVIQPVYNEANLLEREDVWLEQNNEPDRLLDPATASHHSVKNIDYNAKGQREFIEYGNGVGTTYEYDPFTFRLAHMETLRDTEHLQDLFYTYDPAGNIVNIRNDSQQTIYFNGQVVRPDTEYRYDALYRLIEASGREHIGQASQPHTTWKDEFRIKLAHPNDGQAMRNYFEFYEYDETGNILLFEHKAQNGNWARRYEYKEESQIETGRMNNRLTRTFVHPDSQQPIPEQYTHDAHGNMTSMPHLSEMEWNFKDELRMVDKGGGCKAFYVYDTTGQRMRKVVKQNGVRKKERIYLDGFEVYREYNGSGAIELERETLHIMSDKQRVAIVETRVQGNDPFPATLIRYQLGNHLNSASLELDHQARIISYEEYYPYGSTSYQAVRSQTETPKRYRYTGKERDEESGFCYYEMRYYAPWLGRWTSSDPHEIVDGVNTFYYARNNPVVLYDPNGTDSKTPPLVLKKPDKDIGEFKKEELAEATMTVFGELTAKIHPKSSEEAKAIASTIFNRLERIKKTRKEYDEAKTKLDKAKVEMADAASKFEELGKNPTKYKKELGKKEYEEKLRKSKEDYNEAKKEVGKLGKAATAAASEKIAAESRIKKEKRSNTRITLTDIVEQNKEYEGTKKGKEDFKNFPSMSDPEKERNFKRWEIAKKAVEELAKDPSKADIYEYFVSEKIKERAPSSGTTKIGGNIFW
ncbi:MAG: RHS repeat-associated core domain-containing protein, partial [Smithella sp.]